MTLTPEGIHVKLTRIAQLGAVTAVAALALTACAANEPTGNTNTDPATDTTETLSGEIAGSGASSQEVAVQAWTAGFQTANSGVTIAYGFHASPFGTALVSLILFATLGHLAPAALGGFGALRANGGDAFAGSAKGPVVEAALVTSFRVVFLVLALFDNASMWMAVFADMGASLLVVFNGLRLLRNPERS